VTPPSKKATAIIVTNVLVRLADAAHCGQTNRADWRYWYIAARATPLSAEQ